jgi:hypothetical protein
MWETTNLNVLPDLRKKHVECCGLPHLAKNERDMGHPTLCGRERTGRATQLNAVDEQSSSKRFSPDSVVINAVTQLEGAASYIGESMTLVEALRT